MQIQQLSVFIENKPGRLAEITEVLAEAGVDIRAISVADTSDFGILRVIVDRPKEAVIALKEHGMTVSLTNVLAVGIPDEKGAFAKVIRMLANAGIDVEYMYSVFGQVDERACMIFRVGDIERLSAVLTAAGFPPASGEALGIHAE